MSTAGSARSTGGSTCPSGGSAAGARARARRRKDSAGPLQRAVLSRETESWAALRRQAGNAGKGVAGKGTGKKTAKDRARL